ncbi:hypothetical protein J6590_016648 [Homalodisca vitripennis]|nr:hypothetical protein J6590_016648 [Homalodisca vitripennis]
MAGELEEAIFADIKRSKDSLQTNMTPDSRSQVRDSQRQIMSQTKQKCRTRESRVQAKSPSAVRPSSCNQVHAKSNLDLTDTRGLVL